VVNRDQRSQENIRRALRLQAPNLQFVNYLLQQGADPNYKADEKGLSAWNTLLLQSAKVNACNDPDSHDTREDIKNHNTAVEQFIKFGADVWNVELSRHLQGTSADTGQITALIAQQKEGQPVPPKHKPSPDTKQTKPRF